MFAIGRARKQILEKLAERDWAPTDLAAELGKSTETVYNHLSDLADRGVLDTRKVPATTRPKTLYSIGDGFVQYLAVLPGHVQEGAFPLDRYKGPLLRVWMLPQAEFHPFVQEYWGQLTRLPDVAFAEDIRAVGVFGSVARGEADAGSDIDVLVVAEDRETAETVTDRLGAVRIEAGGTGRIALAEVFTVDEYRASWAHDSQFLRDVLPEVHPIYDPDRVFDQPDHLIEGVAATGGHG